MNLNELINLTEFHIPVLEFFNANGELEYRVDITKLDFQDIDVVYTEGYQPFGIIKLIRKNEKGQSKPNGQEL